MKRTIESYRKCFPRAMAHDMSDNAKRFAFEDMKADVIMLWEENLRLKHLLCKAGYPRRGTKEEHMTLQEFAALVQSEISHNKAVNLPAIHPVSIGAAPNDTVQSKSPNENEAPQRGETKGETT